MYVYEKRSNEVYGLHICMYTNIYIYLRFIKFCVSIKVVAKIWNNSTRIKHVESQISVRNK